MSEPSFLRIRLTGRGSVLVDRERIMLNILYTTLVTVQYILHNGKDLMIDVVRSVAIEKTLPHRRVGLRKLLWRAESLDLLGEVGEADDFCYKRRALICERGGEVDIELIRERWCPQLRLRRRRSLG